MSALGLIYLFFITLLLTLFFGYGLRVRGPWGSSWTFFIVILLGVMAADLWIEPIGPYYKDVFWFPPLAVGLFLALLLAAATPRQRTRHKIELKTNEPPEDRALALAVGGFFWLLFALMLIVIILGVYRALA